MIAVPTAMALSCGFERTHRLAKTIPSIAKPGISECEKAYTTSALPANSWKSPIKFSFPTSCPLLDV